MRRQSGNGGSVAMWERWESGKIRKVVKCHGGKDGRFNVWSFCPKANLRLKFCDFIM